MKTAYFDHNVLIKVCQHEGLPPSGPYGKLVSSESIKPVFSPWHWVEAARMRNFAEATQLARLLDWSKGFWLPERTGIILHEIAYSIGKVPEPPRFFNSPREAMASLTSPVALYMVLDSVDIVQRWKSNPGGALSRVTWAYKLNKSSFLKNVQDYRKGKLTPERERRSILRAVMKLAQERGLPLTSDEIERLDVTRMPALSAEVALAKIRWGRGGNLRWQNFVDSAHLVAAMPYVDAYVTYDIRNRKLAVKLRRSCNFAMAEVAGSLQEL